MLASLKLMCSFSTAYGVWMEWVFLPFPPKQFPRTALNNELWGSLLSICLLKPDPWPSFPQRCLCSPVHVGVLNPYHKSCVLWKHRLLSIAPGKLAADVVCSFGHGRIGANGTYRSGMSSLMKGKWAMSCWYLWQSVHRKSECSKESMNAALCPFPSPSSILCKWAGPPPALLSYVWVAVIIIIDII